MPRIKDSKEACGRKAIARKAKGRKARRDKGLLAIVNREVCQTDQGCQTEQAFLTD
jgi:hypothetical protein